ncbi:MAG TPA: glycosyltransferase [Vicinamibacterales bacterium]|nr:glycosyltransferase [Vicinamibacterales bacterium]
MTRVALVHDWLTGMRGGEKVLDAICELYPNAPLYSLIHVKGSVSARIEGRPIRTSVAQRFPAAARLYRQYLPFFPMAVEMFDLDGYDVVISTSHCAVKSIVRPGRAVHVTYCHSPMRYAWDQFEAYFGPQQVGRLRHRVLRPIMAALARWDRATAGRVDRFVANSHYVAGRIRRYYNRGSTVVYPPVDTGFFRLPDDRQQARSGVLVVSALVPYKRLDIAIAACRRAGVPLSIVGTGPERPKLEAAGGAAVTFLGWRSNDEIRELYRRSAAVLLPGVEDFGMVPVEAQACGCPVVALRQGGASETVLHEETGILVDDLSEEAFASALADVRSRPFDPDRLRAHAESFSRERFLTAFQAVVDDATATAAGRARTRQQAVAEIEDAAARRTRPQQQADLETEDAAARRTRAPQQADLEDEQ